MVFDIANSSSRSRDSIPSAGRSGLLRQHDTRSRALSPTGKLSAFDYHARRRLGLSRLGECAPDHTSYIPEYFGMQGLRHGHHDRLTPVGTFTDLGIERHLTQKRNRQTTRFVASTA